MLQKLGYCVRKWQLPAIALFDDILWMPTPELLTRNRDSRHSTLNLLSIQAGSRLGAVLQMQVFHRSLLQRSSQHVTKVVYFRNWLLSVLSCSKTSAPSTTAACTTIENGHQCVMSFHCFSIEQEITVSILLGTNQSPAS
jgi:hypothetical protein